MIKGIKLLFMTVAISFLSGCLGGGNPYMQVDTPQYKDFTSKLIGSWTIESYQYKGKEQIGTLYKKNAKLKLTFDEKKLSIVLPLNNKTIQTEIPNWKKWAPYKNIDVNSYSINISAPWYIVNERDRTMIVLNYEKDNAQNTITTKIKATGSGIPDFGEFEAKELNKITSITSASNAGSKLGNSFGGSMLGDLVSNVGAKIASKTVENIVGSSEYLKPSVIRQSYFIEFKNNKLILTLGDDKFVLVK
jgi:hypothetical protein